MTAILVLLAAGFNMLLLSPHGCKLSSTEEAPEHLLPSLSFSSPPSPGQSAPLCQYLPAPSPPARPVLPLALHHVLLPLLDYPDEVPEAVDLLPLAVLEPAVDREVLVQCVPGR